MTFLILRLKIRKSVQQMFFFFPPLTKCYLGWEELAFPRQKADPSEFHEASLWIFRATLPRPPNITFCLESGLFNKKTSVTQVVTRMLNQVRLFTLCALLLYHAITGWHPFKLASHGRAPPSPLQRRPPRKKPILSGAGGELMDDRRLQGAAADAGVRGAP